MKTVNNEVNHYTQKETVKVSEENQVLLFKKENLQISGTLHARDTVFNETTTSSVFSSNAISKTSVDSTQPQSKTEEDSIILSDVPLSGFHSRKQLNSIINGTFIDKFKPEHQLGPDYLVPAKNAFTSNPQDAVFIRTEETGFRALKPVSLVTKFKNVVAENGEKPALSEKINNEWVTLTYQEYWDNIQTIAKAFIKLGLKRFHSVAVLGFNAPPWFIANFAAIHAGGFSTGIYPTNSPSACEYILRHSQAQIVLVDGEHQLSKILQIRANLPLLKAIVQYKGTRTHEDVFSWDDLKKIGQSMPDEPLQKRIKNLAINQCCSLLYTSGTTGTPKAVMLSQDNFVYVAESFNKMVNVPLTGPINVVSYLPLNHIMGQHTDMYTTMVGVGHIFFAEPDALKGSLIKTLAEVKPFILVSVPRIFEKIKERIEEKISQMNLLKASYVKWALRKGCQYTKSCIAGSPRKPTGYKMAKPVLKKFRDQLGLDDTEYLVTGGAPVAVELMEFFLGLNIVLLEMYGMSESTGPHALNFKETYRPATAGKIMPGFDMKLMNVDEDGNGEICMKGRNIFMGYMFDDENTRGTIDEDGWLHSGDVGRIEDDYLYVTGRIKELIITSGGENIAPVPIEEAVKVELPIISQAVAIGDKRNYLTMLLTVKTLMNMETYTPLETLSDISIKWCRSIGSNAKTVHDILTAPDMKVMKAIQEGINRANEKAVSNAARIRKWKILSRDFSLDKDEISPTMKIKRHVILKKYKTAIDSMYA